MQPSTSQVPGPPSLPIIGSFLWLDNWNPTDCATPLLEKYDSDWVKYRYFHLDVYATRNPEVAKILFSKPKAFVAPDMSLDIFKSFIPNSILSHRGERWKKIRDGMSSTFTPANIKTYRGIVEKLADDRLGTYQSGQTIDVYQESRAFTLDVIYNVLFSTSFDQDKNTKRLKELIDYVITNLNTFVFQPPFMRYLPTQSNRGFRGVISEFKEILTRKMEERRDKPEQGSNDVLSKIMDTDLSNEEVIDNVLLLVLAGHDTTANTLSMVFWNLRDLTNEHKKIRENDDITDVVTECLRLGDVISGTTKQATCDYTIGDITIPKGAMVLLPQRFVTYNENVFTDPYKFDSERPKVKGYNYIHFGGGKRICLGQYLARLELDVFIKKFFERFDYQCKNKPVMLPGLIKHPDAVMIELSARSIG